MCIVTKGMQVTITSAEILHRRNGRDTISFRIDLQNARTGRQEILELDFECATPEAFLSEHFPAVPIRSNVTIGGLS